MFTFSNFKHEWTKSSFPCDVPLSKDYKVFVNGQEVSVYTCRISAYPFNFAGLGSVDADRSFRSSSATAFTPLPLATTLHPF